MAQENGIRKGIKDIFNAFMVKNAEFEGKYDIPISPANVTKFPSKIITFEEAKSELKKENPDFNAVVCFFKDDYKFDSRESGVWAKPYEWLPVLANFEGVIQPDFSTYQDFPKVLKIYNVYRMRAIGCFLVDNGIPVIANYRHGTEETFDFCLDGIPENAFVCISTLGSLKKIENRKRIKVGLEQLVKMKKPKGVIVYGAAPKDIFGILDLYDVSYQSYQSYQTEIERRMEVIA
jgi:hypothetical protein